MFDQVATIDREHHVEGLFVKEVGPNGAWHQDGVYRPIEPPATVSLWVAVDDSTPDNRCMRYIPGSQRLGLPPHEENDREGLVLDNVIVARALP